MDDKTNRISKDEQLSRALEVLEILGGKLPDDYNISQKHITLSSELNTTSENYIEFDNNMIKIIIENNGHRYFWHSMLCKNGSFNEEFDIDYGRLSTVFFQSQLATTTSGFYLYNDTWGSPKIYSDVHNVSIGSGKKKQIFPIDYYFDVVTSYMKSKKTNYKNALVDDPIVIDTIIKMYENPIKQHVSNLTSNDQSWRFEIERKQILSNYDKKVEEYNQSYLKDVKEAYNRLKSGVKQSEAIKDDEIKELEQLQQDYVHKIK